MNPIRILHIEDDEEDVTFVNSLLIKAGLNFSQHVISTKKSLIKALEETQPDIIYRTIPFLLSTPSKLCGS